MLVAQHDNDEIYVNTNISAVVGNIVVIGVLTQISYIEMHSCKKEISQKLE